MSRLPASHPPMNPSIAARIENAVDPIAEITMNCRSRIRNTPHTIGTTNPPVGTTRSATSCASAPSASRACVQPIASPSLARRPIRRSIGGPTDQPPR